MVTFSGAQEADKANAKKKFLLVRESKTRQFAEFLMSNSTAYTGVLPNHVLMTQLAQGSYEGVEGVTVLEELIDDAGDDGDLITAAAQDTDRANNGGIRRDTETVETISGYVTLGTRQANLAVYPTATPQSATHPDLRHFNVVHSNTILGDKSPEYYGAAFPHLFPYNVGTPNSARPVHVSVADGLRHLLRLWTRKFSQDNLFVLVAFDIIARAKACASLAVRIQAQPRTLVDVVNISQSDFKELAAHEIAVLRAGRRGAPPPAVPEHLQATNRVLRGIKHAMGHTFATAEEHKIMKTIVDSYCNVRS